MRRIPAASGFFARRCRRAVTVMAAPAGQRRRRHGARRGSPTMSGISRLPAHRRFDVFHAQDAHFRQCAGDAEAARPDPRLRPHGPSYRQFHRSAPRPTGRRARSWRPTSCSSSASSGSEQIRSEFGRPSTDGRQRRRHRRASAAHRARSTARCGSKYGIDGSPVLLSVGGVEERKNSVRILEAFQQVLNIHPRRAAGHRRRRLAARSSPSTGGSSKRCSPTDRLLEPRRGSSRSGAGRGHAVALSAGGRAGVSVGQGRLWPGRARGDGERHAGGRRRGSRRSPNISHDNDVVWCDPLNVGSIANAMAMVLTRAAAFAAGRSAASAGRAPARLGATPRARICRSISG